VINEVDYDQPGTDLNEFVEIYNGTGASVDLTGYVLDLINGANNLTYLSYDLSPAGTLAAGQYLVVRSSTVTPAPGSISLIFVAASNSVQNGVPDGIAIVAGGQVVDAFCYGGAMTSVTATGVPGPVSLVEGTVLPAGTVDSNTVVASLCRLPNGTDTNNAATDWALSATPTPGAANVP